MNIDHICCIYQCNALGDAVQLRTMQMLRNSPAEISKRCYRNPEVKKTSKGSNTTWEVD